VIAALAFGAPCALEDGRTVRSCAFVPKSNLPLSAACLVANGVREVLARLLASDVDVELFEPAIPGAQERRLLLDGAVVYRVRGRIGDGFVIVRADDARKLVARAYGEDERASHVPLSDLEAATLERIVYGIVPLCNTLCGTLGPVTRESAERAACDLATYFEVRTTGPERIAIGFALTKDPPETVAERITIEDLLDVELAASVEFGSGSLAVPAFSRLAPGATIVLDTALGGSGVLRLGDVRFARGTCGARDGRSAIRFDTDHTPSAA
jgi:flagellar motor switch/type III secretory pathway protein FliN